MSCSRTQRNVLGQPRARTRPLDPETSALSMRPHTSLQLYICYVQVENYVSVKSHIQHRPALLYVLMYGARSFICHLLNDCNKELLVILTEIVENTCLIQVICMFL